MDAPVEFWTECIDRKSLILLKGNLIDIGLFPQYQWVLHSNGEGDYRISELSSGLKACGPVDTPELAVTLLRCQITTMPADAVMRMVERIEYQKQRNFELALQRADAL